MSDQLDFNDAKVGTGNKYLEPGIHNVKVTKVEAGKSSQKQTPYVEITVTDPTGATCSQQYYLSTTVKEGSNVSAFSISKDAILQILMASTGADEATAKSKLVGITTDNIAAKLASIVIGKPFAMHIAGEWVNPTDTTKKSFVKGVFGTYKFAVPSARITELKHDPAKHIKGKSATQQSSNSLGDEGTVVMNPTQQANW